MPSGSNAIIRATFRRLGLLPISLALLALLTGCWPLQQGTSTSGGTPQAISTLPAFTPIPSSANTLNIAGREEDPPTLDPVLANDPYSRFVIRQLFSELVMFDNNLSIVPDLATGLPSVSADGKTYTFTLRRGVRFPDGQEVTSADFKYSLERAADPRLAGPQPASDLPAGLYLGDIIGVADKLAGKAAQIQGVQAPDPYTLVITIDAPKSYFLSKLAAGPTFVLERSNVESAADWTERPAGTGPFRLEKWAHNQEMVLSYNPNYYAGRPKLDRVNIWMGANATEQLQQYETGGLGVVDVPVDAIERVSDRNSPLSKELQVVPGLNVTYLGFNLRQKPFDDPKIREAFTLVIDRQGLARALFQSRVRQAGGFVPPMQGYSTPQVEPGYDVTRARQLVAESTYKEVKNLPRLSLYTSGDTLAPMLRDVFSQTLGVDLEVQDVEWSDYQAGLQRGDYPMFIANQQAAYPDPQAMLDSLFKSDSPDNYTGYKNADVDGALASAAAETDPNKRMSTYSEVEARVLMDFPAVPLFYSVRYTLVKPYVQGLKGTPLGILDLSKVGVANR